MIVAPRIRIAAALVAGAWVVVLAWGMRTSDVKERLRRDIGSAYATESATAVETNTALRSFSERVTPVMADLQRGVDEEKALPEEVRMLCTKVRRGEEPFPRLPQECHSLLDAHRGAVNTALTATRARTLDLPRGVDVLSADYWGAAADGSLLLLYAAKAGTLDLLRLMTRYQPQRDIGKEFGTSPVDWVAAIDGCLDILALGRLLSVSRAFVGLGLANATIQIPFAACARALNDATVVEKHRAQRQLLSLRDGLRSFDDALVDETVFNELAFVRVVLGDAEVSQLPPEAARLAHRHPSILAFWQRWFAPQELRELFRERDALRATADLPALYRTQALKQISASAASSWNPLRRHVEIGAARFYQRFRHTEAILEALAIGAYADSFRVEHGGWPNATEIAQGLPLRSGDLLQFEASDVTFRITVYGGKEPLSFALTPDS